MRLFIAVPLPEPVRRRLAAAMPADARHDPAVRWNDPAQLHITVKFLGAVAPESETAVIDALARACVGARAFPLALEGFGAFPSVAAPRVLWAGVEPAPPLELLQDAVERGMEPLGFAVEGRPFRPHVTLGRVRRGRRADRVAGRLAATTHADTMLVDGLAVLESRPGPAGAEYHERHRVRLAP